MRRKYKKVEPVKCIVILSSTETDDWDKAKRKEDRQLRYINSYAKKHWESRRKTNEYTS